MAESSFPFNPTPVFQAQWSQMIRTLISDGTLGYFYLIPFGDSTGMHVKLGLGSAWVQGFFYENTATLTLAVATADPTHPRIDLLVLHCDEVGGSIHAQVKTGTPAVSPTVPALTQVDGTTWEIPLAHIAVAAAASTITAGNVTDVRSIAYGPTVPPLAPVQRSYGLLIDNVDTDFGAGTGGASLPLTVIVPASGRVRIDWTSYCLVGAVGADATAPAGMRSHVRWTGANTGDSQSYTGGTDNMFAPGGILELWVGAIYPYDASGSICGIIGGLTPGATTFIPMGQALTSGSGHVEAGGTLIVTPLAS